MKIKKILASILAAIILIFIIQNMAIVEMQFLFWSFSLPRALFLLLILGIGYLLGWLWHSHLQSLKESKEQE